jgi:hypothetical protein
MGMGLKHKGQERVKYREISNRTICTASFKNITLSVPIKDAAAGAIQMDRHIPPFNMALKNLCNLIYFYYTYTNDMKEFNYCVVWIISVGLQFCRK